MQETKEQPRRGRTIADWVLLGALSAFVWEVGMQSWKHWSKIRSKTYRLDRVLRSEQRRVKVSARSLRNPGISLTTETYSLPRSPSSDELTKDQLMPIVRILTLNMRKFDPHMLGFQPTDEVDCVDFISAVLRLHSPDLLVAQNVRDLALFTSALRRIISELGYSLVSAINDDDHLFSHRTHSWTIIRQSRLTLMKEISLTSSDTCRILYFQLTTNLNDTRLDDLCIIEANLDGNGSTSEAINDRLSVIHKICDEAEKVLSEMDPDVFRIGMPDSKYETIRRLPMLLVFNCPACLPYSREYRLITERKDAPVILDTPGRRDENDEHTWADDLSVIRWKPATECVLGPFRSDVDEEQNRIDFFDESRETQHVFSTDGLRIINYLCKPCSIMSANDRKIAEHTSLDALFACTPDDFKNTSDDDDESKLTEQCLEKKRRNCPLSDCFPRCFDFEMMMNSNESAKLVDLLSQLTQ